MLTRGRYNESNYFVLELGRKSGGGRIFAKGAYYTTVFWLCAELLVTADLTDVGNSY